MMVYKIEFYAYLPKILIYFFLHLDLRNFFPAEPDPDSWKKMSSFLEIIKILCFSLHFVTLDPNPHSESGSGSMDPKDYGSTLLLFIRSGPDLVLSTRICSPAYIASLNGFVLVNENSEIPDIQR